MKEFAQVFLLLVTGFIATHGQQRSLILNGLPPGWLCMDKVVMVEETEIQEQEQCTHINEESCFDIFKTKFIVKEVEECKESFKKDCYIEYHSVPRLRKVQICHQPLRRDCGLPGNITCSEELETICEKDYHENEIEDDVPDCEIQTKEVCQPDGTWCSKVPHQICSINHVQNVKLTHKTECRQVNREVCGPELCPMILSQEKCFFSVKSYIQEIPSERCNLVPRKDCQMVSKFVPSLVSETNCMDVPKEICNLVEVGSRKIQRPRVKKWCGPNPNFAPTDDEPTPEEVEHLKLVNFFTLPTYAGRVAVLQVYNWDLHQTECQTGIGIAPDNRIITRLTTDKDYHICGIHGQDSKSCSELLPDGNNTQLSGLRNFRLPAPLFEATIKSTRLLDGTWILSGEDIFAGQIYIQPPGSDQFQILGFFAPQRAPFCIAGINDQEVLVISDESTLVLDVVARSVKEFPTTSQLDPSLELTCAALSNGNGYQIVACNRESCLLYTTRSRSWEPVSLPDQVTYINLFPVSEVIHGLGDERGLFTLDIDSQEWISSGNALDIVGALDSQIDFGFGQMNFCNNQGGLPLGDVLDGRNLVLVGTEGTSVKIEVIDWNTSKVVCSKILPTPAPLEYESVLGFLLDGNPFLCGITTQGKECLTFDPITQEMKTNPEVAQTHDLGNPSGVQMIPNIFILTGGARDADTDADNIQVVVLEDDIADTAFTELATRLPVTSRGHCMVRLNESTMFLGGGSGNLSLLFNWEEEVLQELEVPQIDLLNPTCGAIQHENGTQQIFIFQDWINCQMITLHNGEGTSRACPYQFITPGNLTFKPISVQMGENRSFLIIRDGEIYQINPFSLTWERTGRQSNPSFSSLIGAQFVQTVPPLCL